MKTDTVLVAVDLDAHSEMLVDEASDLAAKLSAKLAIVTVLPVKPSVDADVLNNPAAHPVAAKQFREEEAKVLPQLRALGQAARNRGVQASAHVAHGDVADSILVVARRVHAGLVVVGTHGRRGIARMALGSVAESVIRESPLPVVTIRSGALPDEDRILLREVPLEDDGD